ncbi:copper-binding protein [Aromatoleum evansii]|uniref:copper-binding protein n=1 Tax=Aromatoleum evansii TaxID=59406 RepID=UPI00145EDB4A|nr:copper-binding protein [Aromatoleum evansii]NMG29951.1 copper-binding protein [Aromatoleum evansii]
MKKTILVPALATLMLAGSAFAQQQMDGMKGTDMKGMDMGKPSAPSVKAHQAVGVVKALDATAGTVTFAHEAVKSMNWPAMTMTFGIKDKMLLDKLADGKKVEFEFVKEGKDYVVTKVK